METEKVGPPPGRATFGDATTVASSDVLWRSTCTLRARWLGGAPFRGAFLIAPRGQTAYRIVNVRRVNPRRNVRRYAFVLIVERWLLEDVPGDALVFEWRWDRRSRSRRGS